MLGGRPNTLRSVPCALPRCGARQLRGGARHGAWVLARKRSREQRLQVSAHKQPAKGDGEKDGDKKSETEGDKAQKDTGKEAGPEQSKADASAQTDKRSSAPSSDAEDDWGKPSTERLRFIGFAALAVVVAAGALAYVVAQRLSNFSGSRAAQGSPSGPAQHAQAAQTTQHAVSEAHEGDDDADSADKMSWELTDAERSAWHAQQDAKRQDAASTKTEGQTDSAQTAAEPDSSGTHATEGDAATPEAQRTPAQRHEAQAQQAERDVDAATEALQAAKALGDEHDGSESKERLMQRLFAVLQERDAALEAAARAAASSGSDGVRTAAAQADASVQTEAETADVQGPADEGQGQRTEAEEQSQAPSIRDDSHEAGTSDQQGDKAAGTDEGQQKSEKRGWLGSLMGQDRDSHEDGKGGTSGQDQGSEGGAGASAGASAAAASSRAEVTNASSAGAQDAAHADQADARPSTHADADTGGANAEQASASLEEWASGEMGQSITTSAPRRDLPEIHIERPDTAVDPATLKNPPESQRDRAALAARAAHAAIQASEASSAHSAASCRAASEAANAANTAAHAASTARSAAERQAVEELERAIARAEKARAEADTAEAAAAAHAAASNAMGSVADEQRSIAEELSKEPDANTSTVESHAIKTDRFENFKEWSQAHVVEPLSHAWHVALAWCARIWAAFVNWTVMIGSHVKKLLLSFKK